MKDETEDDRDKKIAADDKTKTSELRDDANNGISERPKSTTRGGLGSRLDEL